MMYFDVQKKARFFYPVIALDQLFPVKVRRIIFKLLSFLIIPAFVGMSVWILSKNFELNFLEQAEEVLVWFAAAFFILLPFWIIVGCLIAYRNSFLFAGFDSVNEELGENPGVSYEVAQFCFYASPDDLIRSFLFYSAGRLIMARLGVQVNDIETFVQNRQKILPAEAFQISTQNSDGKIRLHDVASALYDKDEEFAHFLFTKGIQKNNFEDVLLWISRDILRSKQITRWWSKDRLGRVPGIGKDWSYGGAYKLKRYAIDLTDVILPSFESMPQYVRQDIEKLEAVLSKSSEANAILVGDDGGTKTDVLHGFVNKIQTGKIFPNLEYKNVFDLDWNLLIAESGEKSKFESQTIKIFDEAVKAGNVIVAIQNFPGFIRSAKNIGSDAMSVISPYLISADIQIIALSSPSEFHEVLEPNGEVMEKFNVLILKEGEASEVLQMLQDKAAEIEAKQGTVFSQTALVTVADSAERYITTGVMPDKAIDLLFQVAAKAYRQKYVMVDKSYVLEFVKQLTGIPTGEVSAEEKEILINLEKILHERVVGQEEAVTAISNSMKRARAGVQNPNRPMGSFLFMGPTGVGKTETTKALAAAFFHDESRIIRLDMSEYKTADALNKLTGSFETKSPGVLTSMLREKPYGVLLLDEFEKTTKDVMDLFLQILDEGFFSDMQGRKVNARNLIIIATSNAGSDMIWEIMKSGGKLLDHKDEIMDSVIKQGIFKPELLNRFDGVIMFHPLTGDHLHEIAKLMLVKLSKRLRQRGIDLEINDELVRFLMKFGTDPKFGARPMNRAIQDNVEQKIADKIIKGDIKPGQKITLTEGDLAQ